MIFYELSVYRMAREKYADTALSGIGAEKVGGRWTPPGYRAVYTASSVSLALVETLVHVDSDLMMKHIIVKIEVPDSILIERIDPNSLPKDWRASPAPLALRDIGEQWLTSETTLILEVPSVVVPQEFNYIINPLHSDVEQLKVGQPTRFSIDPRI